MNDFFFDICGMNKEMKFIGASLIVSLCYILLGGIEVCSFPKTSNDSIVNEQYLVNETSTCNPDYSLPSDYYADLAGNYRIGNSNLPVSSGISGLPNHANNPLSIVIRRFSLASPEIIANDYLHKIIFPFHCFT